VPVSYSDDIYKLRRDIDLVRRKIAAAIIPASVDSVSDSSA
jgi:hypothetical protein